MGDSTMEKMMQFCKSVNFVHESRGTLNEYIAYVSMIAFARKPKLLGDPQGHIRSLAHTLRGMDGYFIDDAEVILSELKYDHDLSNFIQVQEQVTTMFNANEKEKDALIEALFSHEL